MIDLTNKTNQDNKWNIYDKLKWKRNK